MLKLVFPFHVFYNIYIHPIHIIKTHRLMQRNTAQPPQPGQEVTLRGLVKQVSMGRATCASIKTLGKTYGGFTGGHRGQPAVAGYISASSPMLHQCFTNGSTMVQQWLMLVNAG